MNQFKQNPQDCIGEGFTRTFSVNKSALQGLKNEQGSEDMILDYRKKIELVLKSIDDLMSPFLSSLEEGGPLINWSASMGLCCKMLDTLDKNLAFKGKRQWSWDEVIDAMAFLETVKSGAKLTLWENGIDT